MKKIPEPTDPITRRAFGYAFLYIMFMIMILHWLDSRRYDEIVKLEQRVEYLEQNR